MSTSSLSSVQVLRLRMASLFFAVSDKTSSSELGVELGIKRSNVLRDGYGYTCLVHVRRVATICFAPTLTWLGVVGLCTESCDVGFCFVLDMAMLGPCMESCDVGCCLTDVWSVNGSCDVGYCFVFWHGAVSVLWMEIGN